MAKHNNMGCDFMFHEEELISFKQSMFGFRCGSKSMLLRPRPFTFGISLSKRYFELISSLTSCQVGSLAWAAHPLNDSAALLRPLHVCDLENLRFREFAILTFGECAFLKEANAWISQLFIWVSF